MGVSRKRNYNEPAQRVRDRGITRRDVLHGVGALAAAGLMPAKLSAAQAAANSGSASSHYPPALTGLRGSHAGSFEVAHELAW